jgi:hypothetical protein
MEILVKALAMVAIIALAVGRKKVGLLRVTDFRVLSTLGLWVTLPAALLTAFNGFALDPTLLVLTGLAVVLNTLQQVIGFLLARRQGRPAQAFAVLNSGSYNIGAFSTPYLAGIIGPQAMIFSTMFDIGAAFSPAGSGYAWATALVEPPRRGRMRRVVQTVFRSPVFLTYLLLVALMISRVRLPDPGAHPHLNGGGREPVPGDDHDRGRSRTAAAGVRRPQGCPHARRPLCLRAAGDGGGLALAADGRRDPHHRVHADVRADGVHADRPHWPARHGR